MKEKIINLLFKSLYTSILFQIVFIGIIGFSAHDIYSSIVEETYETFCARTLSDCIYIGVSTIYFVCTYLPNLSMQTRKLAARLCIYALVLSYFIFQTFILK